MLNESPACRSYKWCAYCGACLLAEAKVCRFCQLDVSTVGTKYQLIQGSVGKIHSELYLYQLGYCLAWLHEPFITLIEALPPGQLKRLLTKAISNAKFQAMRANLEGRNEGIEESLAPPKNTTVEILMATAVELAAGTADWRRLISLPRLTALDIGEDSVAKELSRRLGKDGTDACAFCAEQNTAGTEHCLYCGSNFTDWPQAASHPGKREFQRFDETYLRQVILYLGVSNHLLSQPEDERLASALLKNSISEDALKAAAKQAIAENRLPEPRTSWSCKLSKLGIIHKPSWYGDLDALASLGHHLIALCRYGEAELVLNYALTVADLHREVEEVEPSAVMLLGKCYGELAALYQATGQIEQARLCFEKEQEVVVSDLSEAQRRQIAQTKERIRVLKQRLEKGELEPQDIGKQHRKTASELPEALRAVSDANADRLGELDEAIRLSLGAATARCAGQSTQAEVLARRSLSCLTEDSVHTAPIRLNALIELSLAKEALGQREEAQNILLEQAEPLVRQYPRNSTRLQMLGALAKAYKQLSLMERAAFWFENCQNIPPAQQD
jgi:hypothetical protein